MSTNVKRGIWAVALLACLAVVWFSVRGLFAFGEVPISQAPTTAPSPSVSASASSGGASSAASEGTSSPSEGESGTATPSAVETASPSGAESSPVAESSSPAATSSASSAAPTSAAPTSAEPTRTGPPAAPLDEISANPAHIDVYRGDEQVIGAPMAPELQNEDGALYPEKGIAGWYAPPEWGTKPGELSDYPGVVAAHVIHSGGKDVFWRLKEVRQGDRAVITYDDGTVAEFRMDADPVTVDKGALVKDDAYSWAWRLDEPGRKVTLITCELVPGSGFSGESVDNWVVQATRVS